MPGVPRGICVHPLDPLTGGLWAARPPLGPSPGARPCPLAGGEAPPEVTLAVGTPSSSLQCPCAPLLSV